MRKNQPLKYFKEYENVEERFFEIDNERKTALIKLRFNKPSDVLDVNYVTKTPIFSDEFMDFIGYSFKMVPKKYKVRLDVRFDDMEDYDEQTLSRCFEENVILDLKTKTSQNKKSNATAFALIGLGVIFFAVMLLVNYLWSGEGLLKQIVSYVMDIATTVTFWEAFTILVVQSTEDGRRAKDMATRFDGVAFGKVELQ